MKKVDGRERYSLRGGAVKAAGVVVGFVVLCWVVECVVIPAVLWTVLALADGIRVALGMGSVL